MSFRQIGFAVTAICVFAALQVVGPFYELACQPKARGSDNIKSNRPGQTKGRAGKDGDKPSSNVERSDVIIVGAGISGLSAALELGQSGAQVTVIDMSSVFGGHAVMSQGGVCIVDTPVQEAEGIKDLPDLAYRDFIKWGEDANPDWVRYYVDHSRRDIYDWLTELGVRFEGVEPAPGNSVDRFHQPIERGIGLVTPIYRQCLEHNNIKFFWNTEAVKLPAKDGRVVGVLTRNRRTEEKRKFRSHALILATGGFQSNLSMVREFWPSEFRFPERILVGSGRNSVGHGHKLAQGVGAELVKMDHQ